MLVLLEDKVQGSLLYLGAPIGRHLRDLVLGCDSRLKKVLIASDSSSNDIAVVAADAALLEESVLRVLLVLVEVDEFNMWVPLALLELSGPLGSLLGLGLLLRLGLTSADLSLLHWLRGLLIVIVVGRS